MARALRLEYPGALYHVISRGNYKAELFEQKGARDAFLACLSTACERAGWRVHAYVVMNNHYHLALETPKGNLSEGMRWLQSTFANRFNRFRNERGHVFQGRYKALVVENQLGLGSVCHYIHLNPVRAKVVTIDRLSDFRASSFWLLNQPQPRSAWFEPSTCLMAAGELRDGSAGRLKYREYLKWLANDEGEQKRLAFDKMCRGWALGGKEFKKDLVNAQHGYLERSHERVAKEGREVLELTWEAALEKLLSAIGKTAAEVAGDKKNAPWKIAIASYLKEKTTVSNGWLAEHLRMGVESAPSRYAVEFKRGEHPEAAKWFRKISRIKV